MLVCVAQAPVGNIDWSNNEQVSLSKQDQMVPYGLTTYDCESPLQVSKPPSTITLGVKSRNYPMVHRGDHVACTSEKLKCRTESLHSLRLLNTVDSTVFLVGIFLGFRIIELDPEYRGIHGMSPWTVRKLLSD